ncbi:MAG TPA: DUF2752 domain-containing protein [Bacteroidales bacterium]|nr:DUF2752 domain-containing protein [Bacteroidales bacterium]
MNRIIKYSLIACGLMLMVFIPSDLMFQEKVPLCLFKYLTGIECPLCGMTRACYYIMHLHFASAFGYNPVSFMLPVIIATEAGYDIAPSGNLKRVRKTIWLVFLVSLILLFLLRIIVFFLAV